MLYFILVCYDIPGLYLEEESGLHGPFKTEAGREEALKKWASTVDSTDAVANCTFLSIEGDELVREKSFLVDLDADYDTEDEDDYDDYDEGGY